MKNMSFLKNYMYLGSFILIFGLIITNCVQYKNVIKLKNESIHLQNKVSILEKVYGEEHMAEVHLRENGVYVPMFSYTNNGTPYVYGVGVVENEELFNKYIKDEISVNQLKHELKKENK